MKISASLLFREATRSSKTNVPIPCRVTRSPNASPSSRSRSLESATMPRWTRAPEAVSRGFPWVSRRDGVYAVTATGRRFTGVLPSRSAVLDGGATCLGLLCLPCPAATLPWTSATPRSTTNAMVTRMLAFLFCENISGLQGWLDQCLSSPFSGEAPVSLRQDARGRGHLPYAQRPTALFSHLSCCARNDSRRGGFARCRCRL